MIYVLIYIILSFAFGRFYYVYQYKIKECLNEKDGFEEGLEECLFIGLLWPFMITGILVIYIFKKMDEFYRKN